MRFSLLALVAACIACSRTALYDASDAGVPPEAAPVDLECIHGGPMRVVFANRSSTTPRRLLADGTRVFFEDDGAIDSVATDGTGLRVLSPSVNMGDRLFGQTKDDLVLAVAGLSLLSKKDGTTRGLSKALYQTVIATADALYGVRAGNDALELVRISLLDGQPTVVATLDPIVIQASLVASNGFVYAIGHSMSLGSGFDTLRVSRVDGHVERFVRPFGGDASTWPGEDGIVYGVGPDLGRWPDASSKPDIFATNAGRVGTVAADDLAVWVNTNESVVRFGFDGSRATVVDHLYESADIAIDAKCIYLTMPGSLLRFPK